MRSIQSKFKQFEAEGTVFGSINKDDFKALEVINPDPDMLNLFEQLAHPIDQMIENNEKEIIALSGLRDLLLPKLLSGEVKVDNLDNQSGLSEKSMPRINLSQAEKDLIERWKIAARYQTPRLSGLAIEGMTVFAELRIWLSISTGRSQ
jgi:hypothetical protein